MRAIKTTLLCLASLSLFACNSGSSGTSSDVQNISGSQTVGNSSYNIVGLATNCRVTPSNCQVSLTITAKGNYTNSIIGYQIGNQAAQNTSYSTANSGIQQSYNFTIYGNVSTAQNTVITLGGASTTATFTIGGGL